MTEIYLNLPNTQHNSLSTHNFSVKGRYLRCLGSLGKAEGVRFLCRVMGRAYLMLPGHSKSVRRFHFPASDSTSYANPIC